MIASDLLRTPKYTLVLITMDYKNANVRQTLMRRKKFAYFARIEREREREREREETRLRVRRAAQVSAVAKLWLTVYLMLHEANQSTVYTSVRERVLILLICRIAATH